MEFPKLRSCVNHGILRFMQVTHEIPWNSKPYVDKAWNSMNYVSTEIMEFQDLRAYSMEFLGIPSLTQIKHGIP